MTAVHILKANLKALPGKITLPVTEPLTHSLPLPPGEAELTPTEEEGEREHFLPCNAQSVLSAAERWTLDLSGRRDARYWEKLL